MGLCLEVKLEGVPDEQLATLQVLTTNIHGILEDLAVNLGIPSFDVTVVMASDFAGEVSAVLRSVEGDNGEVFTTERIGGAVTGKCIPLADDYSDQVIVLDGTVCQVGDPDGQAWVISQLAHELTHVVIGRARHASGALQDVPRWSLNVVDRARNIARIVTEEYRVDLISSKILERFGTVTDQQGTTHPLTAYDLVGDTHRDELERTLDATVHPGWPDTVQRYRERQLSLEELWRQMSLSTEGVLTLVAHTEAHAAIGGVHSPLDELGQHSSTWRRCGRRCWTCSAPSRSCPPWTPPAPTSSASPTSAAKRSWRCGAALASRWRSTGTTAGPPSGSANRSADV
jgi:hypothetical protein